MQFDSRQIGRCTVFESRFSISLEMIAPVQQILLSKKSLELLILRSSWDYRFVPPCIRLLTGDLVEGKATNCLRIDCGSTETYACGDVSSLWKVHLVSEC